MLPLNFAGTALEMTKRRWKDFMQHTLHENHFDPRKVEELNKSKTDIEIKLPKIIKLVKERRQNRRNRNTEVLLRKESELIELIENIHKQYEFVYGQYDNLRGQLSHTVDGIKEDEGYFTATSSSDSETESEKDVKTEDRSRLNQVKASFISEHVGTMNKSQENENIVQELKEKLDEKDRGISSLARIQKLCQREISSMMKELESEVSSVNVKLEGMCSEKKTSEQQVQNRKLQDQFSKLEELAEEMDKEISQLVKTGVVGAIQEDGLLSEVSKMKGLTVQVNNLNYNVDCLINAQKRDSEQQKARQSNSTNGFAKHENLLDQVNKMKLDLGLMRKNNTELESNIKKKARGNSEFLSQIAYLKKEVAKMADDLQNMQKEKEDLLATVKNLESVAQDSSSHSKEREKLIARIELEKFQLTQEIEVMQGNLVKMEKMLKKREDQFTAPQKRLENGEGDKSAQIMTLITPINRIEQELELKNLSDIQIKIKNNDISKLTEEKESLQGRISELEKKLKDREDEFSTSQNDMSTQIVALTKEVSHDPQENDLRRKFEEQISLRDREITELGEERESLQAKILELEVILKDKEDQIADLLRKSQVGENEISCLQEELSAEWKKFSERLFQLEKQNDELIFKNSDQQFMLKQHEDTIDKLRKDCKLMKGRFLQTADRKMDEMAEEFRKNFEDKLRILSQRIKVSEQLHAENKESCKKMQEQCQQQHPGLEKRITQTNSVDESELQVVSRAVDEMTRGTECFLRNFESKVVSFTQRLSRVSNEVEVAKNWVCWTVNEVKPWKNNEPQGSPFSFTMDDGQDKVLKEKVRRLEAKVNKEQNDNLSLMRGMNELQKKVLDLEKVVEEKEEGLLRLGNEKVEAIRQLCMWVDHQQSRIDQLKEMMLVKKSKGRGRA